MIERIQPQNIDAEEKVITSCLLGKEAFEEAYEILEPSDFYKTSHEIIFSLFIYLFNQKTPIDLITVTSCLRDKKKLDEIGGAFYLAKLTETVPILSNVKHYAEIIKKKASLRDIIKKASDTINECFEDNIEYDDLVNKIQERMINIKTFNPNTFKPMSKLVPEAIERYELMRQKKDRDSIKTGFPTIDLLTGGFRGGKFIIIAARPKVGKTSLMLNMARNMVIDGHKVGIFSIEMDEEELVNKQFSAESGINSMRFSAGTGPRDSEWGCINRAADSMISWDLCIDDSGGLNIHEIKRRSRKLKKDGTEIIFIDQLSKITGSGRSMFETTTKIVNELASFKKEIKIPIVLLAQINRKADEGGDKRPTVNELKMTGSLEEDADIIFLGHREYEYTKNEAIKNEASWELARQRGGPTRNINMYWNEKTTVFSEID